MIAKARQVYSIKRRKVENVIAAPKGYDSKKTLSRVSGKRKKKYHPNGCVDRYKDTFKGLVREGPEE